MINDKITTEREDIVTKDRLKKELTKVDDQLAGLQARKKDLEEQLQMAEDAEKMKFIEKNKISLDRLALLNRVSEEEILSLLKQKEKEQAGQDIVTKDRLKKELTKVDDQLAGLQARKKDLEEQLQMAEDAEKMKFIEKNKISLDRLALLNRVSEEEILSLLKQKEKEQAGQAEKEAGNNEEKQVIN